MKKTVHRQHPGAVVTGTLQLEENGAGTEARYCYQPPKYHFGCRLETGRQGLVTFYPDPRREPTA